MMEPQPWRFEKYSNDCFRKFRVRPDYDKAITMFGGLDIRFVTNVIFTNGMRDPWAPGGVLYTLSPDLISINISHACHHEDLRATGDNDSPQLTSVRREVSAIFEVWLKQYYRKLEIFH